MIYACQVWGLKATDLQPLENKAIRIINFKLREAPTTPLYKINKILKIENYVSLLNCIFVKNSLTGITPNIFSNFFARANLPHNHATRHSTRNSVTLPQAKTVTYGLNSITYQSAKHGNEMQEHLNLDMYSERATLVNKCIFDYFIECKDVRIYFVFYN